MKITPKTFPASGLRRPSRRSGRPSVVRRLPTLLVESLETRQMLTATAVGTAAIPAAYFTPTDTNLFDAQNGPLANLGTSLVSVYQSYATDFAASVAAGQVSPAAATALASQIATQYPSMEFEDGLVDMDINSLGGDFNSFVTQLSSLGMQVTDTSAAYGIVEGWVPLAELPTIARLPQTEAGQPIRVATTHALQGFQGVAYNEPETALGADAARSQFGLTGAGVTVGVISDSVSQVGGGLADSYKTGDLSTSNPVKVLSDGNSSNEDEGRAMLESIHDIAPGASLQFAAAGNTGDLGFMQSIENLYNAGSKVIVDDISEADEPFFQDGLIAQGVDYVTARGDEYFTSAANSGVDNGYLSTFRPVTATVGSGASQQTGTFQNFNGGTGTASPLLKITTGVPNAFINFQYDQPFKTQEPAGATATTTSDMSFYVYNASGALVASGTDDNVATQQPYQGITIPTVGTYYVAIKLVSGTAPGHVEFVGVQDDGAVQVDKSNGASGGTYYPSSEGHETTVAAIGVAATPWFAPAPFQNLGIATPTEASSSTGPGLIDLSPKGTPITATLVQNPAITSADGGTTSFFGQAAVDTTEFPPNTSFNETPTNQQNLKDFFGTSQAAPNAAAVAALMLQEVPTLSRVQILQAMETTATAINNTPQGTYNVQSGYGLLNAVAAIAAIAPSSLAASTVAASSSTSTPTVNQPFTLSAAVAGAKGTPGGSVDFYDISYNTDLGSVALAGGMASLTTTPTVAGAHVYLLTYSGSSTTAASTAYLVLDVVAGGSSTSARARPTATPGAISSALAVPIPIFIDPDLIDDVAISTTPSTTGVSDVPARKHPIVSTLATYPS